MAVASCWCLAAVLLAMVAGGLVMPCNSIDVEYKEVYVDSKIDHFNPLVRQPSTFKQRMLISDKFFGNGSGPILVYVGNEGPIDQFWNNSGFVMELAEAFSGYIVFIEHRYYGKSVPFGDMWQQNYNYQYLTVEQALADYAIILTNLKAQLGNEKRKVVAFGGSYGGMLAAGIRFKYPNIVDGSLAASAPIFPMGKYDFYRAVTEDCERYNEQCPVRIREGYTKILSLASEGDSGFAKITSLFKLCNSLSADTLQHFLLWARNAFTIMAMADYPYPASFLGNLPAYPINQACDTVLNADDALSGLANATVTFYNATAGPAQCLDVDKEYIACADATGCGSMDQWDIQVCLEVRLASGTNNVTDMFPPTEAWSDSMYDDYCRNKYGPLLAYQDTADFYSVNFWGQNIKSASNIIFSNGDLDPWRYGGVLEAIPGAPSLVPILVKGGAHHLDLRGSDHRDPPAVTAARLLEKTIIQFWLQ